MDSESNKDIRNAIPKNLAEQQQNTNIINNNCVSSQNQLFRLYPIILSSAAPNHINVINLNQIASQSGFQTHNEFSRHPKFILPGKRLTERVTDIPNKRRATTRPKIIISQQNEDIISPVKEVPPLPIQVADGPKFKKPHAPKRIVKDNQVLQKTEILVEHPTLSDLCRAFVTCETTIEWLACHGLISNTLQCEQCKTNCCLKQITLSTDGYVWKCKRCESNKSIRQGSIFARSTLLSLKQLMIVIYCWCYERQEKDISLEAGVEQTIVSEWIGVFRMLCERDFERNPPAIGGVNEDGTQSIVELAQFYFSYRYSCNGDSKPKVRMLFGVERHTPRCFIVELNVDGPRSCEEINFLVSQFVLPGSHIISDASPLFDGIGRIKDGVYTHSVVTKKRSFIDAENPTFHTQSVKNLWMRAKMKFERFYESEKTDISLYIYEWMWRNKWKDRSPFSSLLIAISEEYPLLK